MDNQEGKYGPVVIIENLLEEVLVNLSELTEANFDEKFLMASSKMEKMKEIKFQNTTKTNDFSASKKNIHLAKLISDKYDNIVKDWADKLKTVQKEIELTQNQKKITIYNR